MPKSKRNRRSKSASGYFGVTLSRKRYQALIYKDGKMKGLGTYDTTKQAAKAYDAVAIELGRPLSKLNFPKKVPPGYIPRNNGQISTNTSGYRGVSKTKWGYQAKIMIKGKVKFLGYFNTRKQAAVAYDHAVHKHHLSKSSLNFPSMKHNLNKEPKGKKKQKVRSSTGFRGVSLSGKKYKYQLTIVAGKREIVCGFASAEDAARAYDQAILKYNHSTTKLNFPPQTTNDEIQIKEEPKDDQISSNSEWL
jgi:hypothetical protein